MYEAKIEDSKIVLTPPADPHFSRLPKKEIPLSEIGEKVGYIEALDLRGGGDPHSFYLHLKGQESADFVTGPSLKDLRAGTAPLVEIDSIGALIPFELMFDEPRDEGRDRVDAFLVTVFNDVAAGRENRDGYLTRAFVNPAAVESVEDEGGYRTVNIREEFGGKSAIASPLPAAEPKKRLGLSAPKP